MEQLGHMFNFLPDVNCVYTCKLKLCAEKLIGVPGCQESNVFGFGNHVECDKDCGSNDSEEMASHSKSLRFCTAIEVEAIWGGVLSAGLSPQRPADALEG